MSDDYTPSFEEMSYEDMRGISEEAWDAGFDIPDIDKYLDNYTDEWVEAWDAVPWHSLDDDGNWHDFTSDAQIDAFIDLLLGMDPDDWPDWDAEDFDFWEWWEDNYG